MRKHNPEILRNQSTEINTKHLHIVCHDVPYPPDYGGVFDLFFKLKALHEVGVSVYLHCFEYGRGMQQELNKYCTSVIYYERKSILKSLSLRVPYIVRSRKNNELLRNLLKDKYPVLLEGVHCTWFLYKNKLGDKKTLVRLHNVEYEYYSELAKSSSNILKKLYFFTESKLLKNYENSLAGKAFFMAVNEKDKNTYINELNAKNVAYLPVFLPFSEVASEPGNGSFCLYHGNLSVPENEKAVLWILRNVFDTIKIPFVIAGKNPSKKLSRTVHKNKNVCLVANPAEYEMDELINKAHIHLLPSFNKTGIKIKLLNALYNGKFIVTNNAGVEGTIFTELCEIANSPEEYKNTIHHLFTKSFTEKNILERKQILENVYDKKKNVQKLIQWIW